MHTNIFTCTILFRQFRGMLTDIKYDHFNPLKHRVSNHSNSCVVRKGMTHAQAPQLILYTSTHTQINTSTHFHIYTHTASFDAGGHH